MNGMLTAANKNFRSMCGIFTNFYVSASSIDSVSEEIYIQQAFCICTLLLKSRGNCQAPTLLLQ